MVLRQNTLSNECFNMSKEFNWLKYFSTEDISKLDNQPPFNILLIGQKKSGKSLLCNLLRKKQEISTGFTLFDFFAISYENNEEETVLNFWCLNDYSDLEGLAEVPLTNEMIETGRFLVILLVNLSKPSKVFGFIDNWVEYLTNRIKFSNCQENDNLFNVNSIPFLILGNQVDVFETSFQNFPKPLSMCHSFVSQLRTKLLTLNSSIVFISCKTGENIELLRNYLFNISSSSDNKFDLNEDPKSLFIPFHCDSKEKINVWILKYPEIDSQTPISNLIIQSQDQSILEANKLEYELTSDSAIKSFIKLGIEQIESNYMENSDNLNNQNTVNAECIQQILFEIHKMHDKPFEEFIHSMDERVKTI